MQVLTNITDFIITTDLSNEEKGKVLMSTGLIKKSFFLFVKKQKLGLNGNKWRKTIMQNMYQKKDTAWFEAKHFSHSTKVCVLLQHCLLVHLVFSFIFLKCAVLLIHARLWT